MRRAGRLVFVVFLAWLLAIVLAGLGLIPGAGIPLTHALRPSTPPPLAAPPQPKQPEPADLRPALTAAQADAILGPAVPTAPPATPGKSGTAPGRTRTAPAATGTTPGRSATAPGHTKTTTTTTTVTTSPGRSGKIRVKPPPPGRTK